MRILSLAIVSFLLYMQPAFPVVDSFAHNVLQQYPHLHKVYNNSCHLYSFVVSHFTNILEYSIYSKVVDLVTSNELNKFCNNRVVSYDVSFLYDKGGPIIECDWYDTTREERECNADDNCVGFTISLRDDCVKMIFKNKGHDVKKEEPTVAPSNEPICYFKKNHDPFILSGCKVRNVAASVLLVSIMLFFLTIITCNSREFILNIIGVITLCFMFFLVFIMLSV